MVSVFLRMQAEKRTPLVHTHYVGPIFKSDAEEDVGGTTAI